jgi:hypothetical protein
MTYLEWNKYITNNNINTYLENVAAELAHQDVNETYNILSDLRNEMLTAFKHYAMTYITPTKNVIEMLQFIQRHPDTISAVVVSNNSNAITDIIREVIPELNKITKWYVRDSIPNSEIYTKTVEMYYNQEKYIVGFENTNIGYESLRNTTDIVYLYIDEYDEHSKRDNWYYKKDAFIFDDFRSV